MNGQDLDIQSSRTVKLATQVAEINEHLVEIIEHLGGQDGNGGDGSGDYGEVIAAINKAIAEINGKLGPLSNRLQAIENWKNTLDLGPFAELLPQLKLLSYLFLKHCDPENLPEGIFLEKVYRQMTDRELARAVKQLDLPREQQAEIKWIEREVLKLKWIKKDAKDEGDVDTNDKPSTEQAQAFEDFLEKLKELKKIKTG